MSDQCKHCTVRGDMEKCTATECNQHESWYAQKKEAVIRVLAEETQVLESQLEQLKWIKYVRGFHEIVDQATRRVEGKTK